MSVSRATVLVGEEVFRLLQDPESLGALMSAWSGSPLRCGFSHPSYLQTWYARYAQRYVPVLCVSHHDNAAVSYVALSQERATATLTGAGGLHAEYHAAYCGAGDGSIGTMIPHAIEATRSKRLLLRFIESRAQAQSLQRALGEQVSDFRAVARPLRRLQSGAAELSALRKSGTRSKLRRLERTAPVRFEQIADPVVLTRTLAALTDWYDLRIGAMGGGLPFREEPMRASWMVDALTAPDSPLRASHLLLGEQPIAMHVGVATRRRISLGALAFDSRYAANSPAKILLHSLFAAAVEQGVDEFDLTPYGEYKDRYANAADEVFVVGAEFARSSARRMIATIARSGTSALKRFPRVAAPLREGIQLVRYHGVTGAILTAAHARIGNARAYIFRLPVAHSSGEANIRVVDAAAVLSRMLELKLPVRPDHSGRPSLQQMRSSWEHYGSAIGIERAGTLVAWAFAGRLTEQRSWIWGSLPDSLSRRDGGSDGGHEQLVAELWSAGADDRELEGLVRAIAMPDSWVVSSAADAQSELLLATHFRGPGPDQALAAAGARPLGLLLRSTSASEAAAVWRPHASNPT